MADRNQISLIFPRDGSEGFDFVTRTFRSSQRSSFHREPIESLRGSRWRPSFVDNSGGGGGRGGGGGGGGGSGGGGGGGASVTHRESKTNFSFPYPPSPRSPFLDCTLPAIISRPAVVSVVLDRFRRRHLRGLEKPARTSRRSYPNFPDLADNRLARTATLFIALSMDFRLAKNFEVESRP